MNCVKRILRASLSKRTYARLSRANHLADTIRRYGYSYFRSKYVCAFKIDDFGSIDTDTEGPVEIHTITGRKDLTMALWGLMSWYVLSNRRDPLCIHDDGSLSPSECERIRRLFPQSRIVMRRQAEEEMGGALKCFPNCRGFRTDGWPISAQLCDYAHFCSGDRLISFDSDILFLRPPSEAISVLSGDSPDGYPYNWFARGWSGQSRLPVEQDVFMQRTGISPHPELNAGFGVLYRKSMTYEKTEEIFRQLSGLTSGRPWWTQTMVAMLAESWGVKFFSPNYQVGGKLPLRETVEMKHYTLPIRELFWAEGIPATKIAIHGIISETS